MHFQIKALSYRQFEPLFSMPETKLEDMLAYRTIVDKNPGYPCRVSLADAEIGETVLLTHYQHQSVNSPFRSSHAIYIRQNAKQCIPGIDAVPEVLLSRLISIRAFDKSDLMIEADIVNGAHLSEKIPNMLRNQEIEYLHLHYAKPGCFAACAIRI